jgi:hypothetical protein
MIFYFNGSFYTDSNNDILLKIPNGINLNIAKIETLGKIYKSLFKKQVSSYKDRLIAILLKCNSKKTVLIFASDITIRTLYNIAPFRPIFKETNVTNSKDLIEFNNINYITKNIILDSISEKILKVNCELPVNKLLIKMKELQIFEIIDVLLSDCCKKQRDVQECYEL